MKDGGFMRCKCKRLLIFCCLLLSLMTTACSVGTAGGITARKSTGLTADIPKHIVQKLSNEIVIDADVSVPEGVKSVPILSASPFLIDFSKLNSTFIGKNETENSKNKDGSVEYFTSGLVLDDKDGKPIVYGMVSTQPNDRVLIHGKSQTIFMTMEYNYIYYAFQSDPTSENYNIALYKHTKSLPFMALDTAFKNVVHTVNNLGISVDGVHDTFCLDHDTTSSINGLDHMTKRLCYIPGSNGMGNELPGKIEYSEHDDFYYFKLYPKYHGIPITDGDGMNIDGGAIDVAYSERGIEYFAANTLYKQTGVLKANVDVYGLDGALQALRHKYAETIISDPIKVTGIRFCYVPVPVSKNSEEVKLIPAWSFDVNQTVMDITGDGIEIGQQKGTPKTESVKVYFDASTGNELFGSSPRI